MSHPSRRARFRHTVVALVTLALAALLLVPASGASAANSNDFNPGYLISDAQFFNGDAMNATQVYSFLSAVNSGCSAGSTCILNYKQSIAAKSATPMCKAISAASGQSAARIIAIVGHACGVSPKAIMVILQKEQSLITSKAPGSRAWWYAMGAGCPDSTGCTTTNTGLYEQVYYGASLLKRYTMPPGTGAGTDYPTDYSARYKAGATSKILYNPKSSCGSKAVFVANQATHALYIYTPYQPNAAALKNLYGTGDSCSAYGNRNFWRMYTDWFGPAGEIGMVDILDVYGTGSNATTLGAPSGELVRDEANGGVYQQYANGIIAWTAKLGAHVILAPFSTAWTTAGGASGLGWPTADTVKITADSAGMTQVFQTGMLAKASGKSTFTLSSAMRDAYVALKGPGGVLGWPSAKATTTPAGTPIQAFENATLFTSGGRYGYVGPELLATYLSLDDVTGILGWPTSGYSASTVGNGGGFQTFDKGQLYSSTDYGILPVYGALSTGYKKYGGLDALGWPTAVRGTDAGTGAISQQFESGLVLTDGKQYALMADPFLTKARTLGLISGKLGWPTGPAQQSAAGAGGVFQEFAGGTLTSEDGGDLLYVYGGMVTVFDSTGKTGGTLGWPTSNRYTDPKLGTIDQDFEKATIFYKGTSYGVVGVNFVDLARARGVAVGALGWPTSGVGSTSVKGGGQYQVFSGGALTWQSDNGALYVPTAIWTAQRKAGGFAGTLGWPTAAATYNATTKTITQKFDGGTITWSSKAGAKVTLNK